LETERRENDEEADKRRAISELKKTCGHEPAHDQAMLLTRIV